MAVVSQHSITDRMLGALRLDAAMFEEIEADGAGTGQAAFVVVATSLVAGAAGAADSAGTGLLAGVGALIGWAISAFFAYVVGTRILPGQNTKASWGELARTMGFANTPRFLLILGVVPALRSVVALVAGIWVLAATIIALRAALDCSTGRAIVVGIVAAFAQALVVVILLSFVAASVP